jgi:hypothetical protein
MAKFENLIGISSTTVTTVTLTYGRRQRQTLRLKKNSKCAETAVTKGVVTSNRFHELNFPKSLADSSNKYPIPCERGQVVPMILQ